VPLTNDSRMLAAKSQLALQKLLSRSRPPRPTEILFTGPAQMARARVRASRFHYVHVVKAHLRPPVHYVHVVKARLRRPVRYVHVVKPALARGSGFALSGRDL